VPAPDFSLPNLSGQFQTLSTLRGKALLLNFWSAHSADCQKDLKTFQQVFSHWQSRGLQLLTVNVDAVTERDPMKALARQRGLTFPILLASDEVSAVYNLLYRALFDRHRDLALPTSFLVDSEGDIVKIYQGLANTEQVEQDARKIPQTNSERLAKALPFPGVSESFTFGRNYLSLGAIFFQRGYMEQSAMWFRFARRDDPSSAEACYGLGSALLSQQKTAEARENFERATKLHASYPDTLANAWNNLGLLAAGENRTDEAVRCFQEALRLRPENLIALNNLGNAYRLQKNWSEARSVFERALAVNPDDPEANYGLGMVFAQADETTRAEQYLHRALKSRPAYPEALNNLGILYLRTQRRDEAVKSFEECVRVAPAFDQSYLNLARIYALEGAPQKARSVLLALLQRHPDHAQAQSMLAHLPQ
jgi:tetratricopeptide (TPR) repeat protein